MVESSISSPSAVIQCFQRGAFADKPFPGNALLFNSPNSVKLTRRFDDKSAVFIVVIESGT